MTIIYSVSQIDKVQIFFLSLFYDQSVPHKEREFNLKERSRSLQAKYLNR